MRPAVNLWTDRRSKRNGHRNLQIRTVEHQAWPVLWCLHTPQKCSNTRPNIARNCQHQHRPRKRGNNSFPLLWGKFLSVVVEISVCALDGRKSLRALIDQSETEVRYLLPAKEDSRKLTLPPPHAEKASPSCAAKWITQETQRRSSERC